MTILSALADVQALAARQHARCPLASPSPVSCRADRRQFATSSRRKPGRLRNRRRSIPPARLVNVALNSARRVTTATRHTRREADIFSEDRPTQPQRMTGKQHVEFPSMWARHQISSAEAPVGRIAYTT